MQNFGRNSTGLTPAQLEDAASAFEKLGPHGVSLNEVVAQFLRRRATVERSVTFSELFERFVAAKQDKAASYLCALHYTFPRFPSLHGRTVSEISPEEIETAMGGMTAAVRNNFMRNLRAVFKHGIKRGWLAENPIERLDFETIRKKEVVTLSPREAVALMAAAERKPELLPYNAMGLFAGIRPLELERLDWKHIDLTERHIEVTAEVSKTGRWRIIEMEPNLVEWLSSYAASRGGKREG